METTKKHRKTGRIIFCVLLAAALLTGCAAGSDGTVTANETAVTVSNDTGWPLYELYIVPSTQEDWGGNYLDEAFDHGESMDTTLSGESGGDYDIEAVTEYGDLMDFYDVPLRDGDEVILHDASVTVFTKKGEQISIGGYYTPPEDTSSPDEQEEETSDSGEGEAIAVSQDMNAELVDDIYALMQACNYEVYWDAGADDWNSYNEEERRQLATDLLDFAHQVGATPEEDVDSLQERLDWECESGGSSYSLWSMGCHLLNIEGESLYKSHYTDIYLYKNAVDEGTIQPAPDEIIGIADSLLPLGGGYEPLLCLGRNHLLHSITLEWATKEDVFVFSSTVSPVEDVDQFFYCDGENGVIQDITLGDVELLPLLAKMGVTGEDGAILHDPIQFYAVNLFDAPQIFVLSTGETGATNINMLLYDQASGEYAWDGETYLTNELCCFSEEGTFYYIDESGNLQHL